MSGKGSLLAKPSGTSLAWKTLFWAYVTIEHVVIIFFLCEEHGTGSRLGIWQGMKCQVSGICPVSLQVSVYSILNSLEWFYSQTVHGMSVF